MKNRFLNSTLALAFFSALLCMIGYAYDVSYLIRLHLTEYLPPTYLEVARPFYLAFVKRQVLWRVFGAIGVLVAIVGILSASWPPFQRNLHRITTFLRRIPLGFYILTAAIGYITLTRWVVNFGWTTADRDYRYNRQQRLPPTGRLHSKASRAYDAAILGRQTVVM